MAHVGAQVTACMGLDELCGVYDRRIEDDFLKFVA